MKKDDSELEDELLPEYDLKSLRASESSHWLIDWGITGSEIETLPKTGI